MTPLELLDEWQKVCDAANVPVNIGRPGFSLNEELNIYHLQKREAEGNIERLSHEAMPRLIEAVKYQDRIIEKLFAMLDEYGPCTFGVDVVRNKLFSILKGEK